MLFHKGDAEYLSQKQKLTLIGLERLNLGRCYGATTDTQCTRAVTECPTGTISWPRSNVRNDHDMTMPEVLSERTQCSKIWQNISPFPDIDSFVQISSIPATTAVFFLFAHPTTPTREEGIDLYTPRHITASTPHIPSVPSYDHESREPFPS